MICKQYSQSQLLNLDGNVVKDLNKGEEVTYIYSPALKMTKLITHAKPK